MSHILIVEDEPVIRGALRKLLERHQHSVEEAGSAEEAGEKTLSDYDLIICDLRLPGASGTSLIDAARPTPVLIMTSYASLRSAVDAMRQGAVDYIAKPFDHDEMLLAVDRVLRENSLSRHNQALQADVERSFPVRDLVAESAPMQELVRQMERVAGTDATVLISGEPGTGKELMARTMHSRSPRARAPIMAVNCAAIPRELLEAELFGQASEHRRGLVEAADGGTLFLDEVGELPVEAQSRLLRLLDEGEFSRIDSHETRRVDVRLVAACTREPSTLMHEAGLREDLYYRLKVVQLTLPPLRERGEDIPALAHALLSRLSEHHNCGPLHFSRAALETMAEYHWPGNVREMENAVERAVILAEGPEISPELLALHEPAAATESPGRKATPRRLLDPQEDLSLEDYFTRFVLENQESMTETELAQKLGISRKCLWERRQRLGIPRKKAGAGSGS